MTDGIDPPPAAGTAEAAKTVAPLAQAPGRQLEGQNRPFALVEYAWTAIFIIALMMALWLQRQTPQRELFLAINSWATQFPASAWSALTLLGETPVLFAALSPLLLWRPKLFAAVLAAVPLGGLLSVALKAWAHAPRPATLIDNTLFTIIGPVLNNASFPSGHTLTAFAAAVAVVMANRADKSRWVVAPIALLLAGGVGCSRMAVGAHWPVDVWAGAACGALAGQSGAWLAGRFPALWQSAAGRFAIGQAMLLTALWLLLRPADYPLGRAAIALAVVCALMTVLGQFVAWRRLIKPKPPDGQDA